MLNDLLRWFQIQLTEYILYVILLLLVTSIMHCILRILIQSDQDDPVVQRNRRMVTGALIIDLTLFFPLLVLSIAIKDRVLVLNAIGIGIVVGVIWKPVFAILEGFNFTESSESVIDESKVPTGDRSTKSPSS